MNGNTGTKAMSSNLNVNEQKYTIKDMIRAFRAGSNHYADASKNFFKSKNIPQLEPVIVDMFSSVLAEHAYMTKNEIEEYLKELEKLILGK